GCNNGLILSGARVYYAMARDDLFFTSAGVLHPKYKTPAVALVVQAVWTGLLCLSGTYTQLLNFVIFAALVFYGLTAVGLFALRAKRPAADRPVRAPGYPWLPARYRDGLVTETSLEVHPLPVFRRGGILSFVPEQIPKLPMTASTPRPSPNPRPPSRTSSCPDCGGGLVRQSGCLVCVQCGWAR